MTSDDIRFSDVTNCPNTCRLDIISPSSFCSWRAADTACSRSMWCSQYPEGGSAVAPARAPQRILETAGGVAEIHTPDPPQSYPRYRTTSYDIDTPADSPRRVEQFPTRSDSHQRRPAETGQATQQKTTEVGRPEIKSPQTPEMENCRPEVATGATGASPTARPTINLRPPPGTGLPGER